MIRNFILLIASAVLIGTVGMFAIAYKFGPSGTYQVQNVLLAPETIPNLASSPSGSGEPAFRFDSIEYLSYNDATRTWESTPVDISTYKSFFSAIRYEESLKQVPDKVAALFHTGKNPRLLIKVQLAESATPDIPQVFQEVQFSNDGKYFRVQLYGKATTEWAYFAQKTDLASILKAQGR
jgi:hypothetical protein